MLQRGREVGVAVAIIPAARDVQTIVRSCIVTGGVQ
jgi:hypothetical protein